MSASMTEGPMVFAELWLSFGSLVRAYAAAASVHAAIAPEVTVTEQTVSVTAGSARLDMACDRETGAGNWQLSSFEAPVTQGRLQLLPDGRIALNRRPHALDHAAIDLVASVMKAAANPVRDSQ